MITLVTLSSLNDAFVLRSMLEANDIFAFIPDENTAQVDWGYINAIGGVRVQISEEDSEKALIVLAEFKDNLKSDATETTELLDDVLGENNLAKEPTYPRPPPRETSLGGVVLIVLTLAVIAGFAFLLMRSQERKTVLAEAFRAYDGGDFDLSIADYSRGIELGAKTSQVFFNRGVSYESRGDKNHTTQDYDRAIADYSKAIEINPGSAASYGNRACLYMALGNFDKAIWDLNKAAQLDPENGQNFLNRGDAQLHSGKFAAAITDYTQAIQLDSKNVRAYANRGIAYDDLDEYDQAIADYTHALQLDSKDETTYINRARAYWQKKDLNKALADYNEALLLNPNDSQVFNYRGNVHEILGNFEKSLADFDQAIQIDPNYEDAYNNFAWLLASCPQASIRDGKRAVELATKAWDLSGWKDRETMDTLAAAYAEAGDFANAVKWESSYLEPAGPKSESPADIQKRLDLYKHHKPYRDSNSGG